MKERKMGDQKCYKMTTDSIQNIPPHFASNEGKKEKKKKKGFYQETKQTQTNPSRTWQTSGFFPPFLIPLMPVP